MRERIYKKIFHPYTSSHLISLERWLSKKAAEGWGIVDINWWIFTFEKRNPNQSKFISYYRLDKGGKAEDKVFFAYLKLLKSYKRRKKTINASFEIFEADIDKIGSDVDDYILLRSKSMRKFHHSFLIVYFCILTLLACLSFANIHFPALAYVLFLALFIEKMFSVCTITKEINKHKSISLNGDEK